MLKKEDFIKKVVVVPFTATDWTQWYSGRIDGKVYWLSMYVDNLPQLCWETYCHDLWFSTRSSDDEVYFDQMDLYY